MTAAQFYCEQTHPGSELRCDRHRDHAGPHLVRGATATGVSNDPRDALQWGSNPAEELRGAAERIRALAEKATGNRWWTASGQDQTGTTWNEVNADTDDGVLAVVTGRAEATGHAGDWLMAEDQQHIAAWDPAVAVTVAAWLERTAASVVLAGDEAKVWEANAADALAVARAFMGGEQQ